MNKPQTPHIQCCLDLNYAHGLRVDISTSYLETIFPDMSRGGRWELRYILALETVARTVLEKLAVYSDNQDGRVVREKCTSSGAPLGASLTRGSGISLAIHIEYMLLLYDSILSNGIVDLVPHEHNPFLPTAPSGPPCRHFGTKASLTLSD